MKKKAMLDSRKSDFSRMWSTFSARTSSRMSSSTMPMTLAGKGKGRTASTIWLIQQMVKMMAI